MAAVTREVVLVWIVGCSIRMDSGEGYWIEGNLVEFAVGWMSEASFVMIWQS